jgi:hypothetical protein
MAAKKPAKPKLSRHTGKPLRPTRGRPPHEPTDATRLLVRELKAAGCTNAYIARRVGIGEDTLARHYGAEIEDAMQAAVSEMARSLYARGLAGDNACAIFWLKCRAGWREKGDDHEATQATPVKVVVEVKDARRADA